MTPANGTDRPHPDEAIERQARTGNAARPAAALRVWLLERALPLWLQHGTDKIAGGFHETLDPLDLRCSTPFRRLRVAARQTYVAAEAYRHGVRGAAAALDLGLRFLRGYAALPSGGYAWRFDLANQPIDTTVDLYDQAFVLWALASAACVIPADELRAEALALTNFIAARFPHPAGGYQESLPPALPRRQNPHMHLLEAVLAAHAAFGDQIYLEQAHDLVRLFQQRFFDPATGALAEFFGDTLLPERNGTTFTVEPGHHFEWIWLLHQYVAVTHPDDRLVEAALRLHAFADRFGQHPATADVIDSVESDGTAASLSARLWPQTERLRALTLPGIGTESEVGRAAGRLTAWLLPNGLWHERRDPAGNPVPCPVPASSLYHLTGAILAAG